MRSLRRLVQARPWLLAYHTATPTTQASFTVVQVNILYSQSLSCNENTTPPTTFDAFPGLGKLGKRSLAYGACARSTCGNQNVAVASAVACLTYRNDTITAFSSKLTKFMLQEYDPPTTFDALGETRRTFKRTVLVPLRVLSLKFHSGSFCSTFKGIERGKNITGDNL